MSKTPDRGALLDARTAREREWCYEMWMRRLTFRQIRAAANLPVEQGGLGYDLSVEAVRNLVAAHRQDRGDVTLSREERVERQSDELDELARALRQKIAEAHDAGGLDVHAIKLLLDVGKREAELHGLAAPTRVEAEVTHHDGVTAELVAMLGEAGVDVPEEMSR